MKRFNLVIVWTVVWMLLSASGAFGQRTTATLFGRVEDPSGAVVAGAAVRLVDERTGSSFEAGVNGVGEFTFPFVPVGRYALEASAPGFAPYRKTGLDLSAGLQLQITIPLALGSVSDRVEVSAEAPVVLNASATLNDTISRSQLAELPQARRDFTTLLTLQNGVQKTSRGGFTISGVSQGGTSITVDGTDAAGSAEDPIATLYGNFNLIPVISQEAIQEVGVSKGVMLAESARAAGGQINVITRSGTNNFHGSLFENFQNDVLNARYFFQAANARKSPVRFNQFGGSFGGPIVKDRLFFFGVYEGYRQKAPVDLVGNVPTSEFRTEAAAALPAYGSYLQRFPLPNQPYTTGAITGLYRASASGSANDNHGVLRVDAHIAERNLLTARYTRSRPDSITPRVIESNQRSFAGLSEVGTLNFIRSSASWSSESRFGVNATHLTRGDGSFFSSKTPAVSLTGQFSDSGEIYEQDGTVWSLEEVIAKTVGRHSFKAGATFLHRRTGQTNEEIPVFAYANRADLLANRPNTVTFTFGTRPWQGHSWELGFFAQDDFRVRPGLVLNLGLRYDYYSVYKSFEGGRFLNPDGLQAAVQIPPRMRPEDSPYDADRNNFGPRAGFAWSLDKQSGNVMRGGFGVFVASMPVKRFSTSVYRDLKLPFRLAFTRADITAFNLLYPMSNDQAAAIVTGLAVPRSYETYGPQNPNPYTMQWTLDYQRRLTSSMALQVGYAGNRTLKIPFNIFANFEDRLTGIRPNPAVLSFRYYPAGDATTYHGLEVTLRKKHSRNLGFNLHYTWSKVISLIGNGEYYTLDQEFGQYFGENNWRDDRGPTLFDRSHRLTADAIYEIPAPRWGGGSRLAGHLLGGWQISSIINAQTGAPFHATMPNSRRDQRPDYIGGDPYAHTGDRFVYLNPAAFARVPISAASGQTIRGGTLGKNALRGPGLWTVDLGLAKSIVLRENWRLQVRADAFNSFNHTNLSNPNRDITNVNFGKILSAGQERRMQLGVRLVF